MVREKQLSRLYLTITHQLIGGMDFRTLLTGSTLGPEGNLTLKSMYYEPNSPRRVRPVFHAIRLEVISQHRKQAWILSVISFVSLSPSLPTSET